MSAILTILVVAPNEELRRSIEFALEAEGFDVASHALLTMALTSPNVSAYACAVIDEEAVTNPAPAWEELGRFTRPIVLLCDRLRGVPESFAMTVLHKPLLGRTLTDTVIGAVANGGTRAAPT